MSEKLNVGCGNKKIHGFTNVDVRQDVQPDVVADISKLSEQFYGVDLIYACHVLEHFPWKPSSFAPVTYVDVLKDWYETLRDGGVLRLAVPNFDVVIEHYLRYKDFKVLRSCFWGGQKYDNDFHYHGWTFDTLKEDLEKVGFKQVKKYDWRTTEHSFIDDYSQAYLPHMDKVNGTLMSLNVEAVK